MIQFRHLEFVPKAARLKPAVMFALLLAASLLTASFQTHSEAFEDENPAASSEHSIAFEYGGKLIHLYSMDENQLDELRRNQSDSENALNQVLRVQSGAEIALEKEVLELSVKLKQLSETADGPASPDPASGNQQADQLATQLKDAVEKSFNERQRQQLAEIERLTTRLNRLAESVQQREAEREQIISRKIDELLGKSSTKTSTNVLTPEELQWITARSMKLLYFHDPYCQPCQKMNPEITALTREGIPVEFVDISRQISRQVDFAIHSELSTLPTVVTLVHGKVVSKTTGFLNREALRSHIRTILKDRSEELKSLDTNSSSVLQPGVDGTSANVLSAIQSAGDGTSEASSKLPAKEKGDVVKNAAEPEPELFTSRQNSVSWDELRSIQEALIASRSVVSGVRANIKDIRKRLDIFRQPFSNWDSVVRDEFQKEFNEVRSNLRPSAHYRGKKFSEDIARLIWEDRRTYEENKVINYEQTERDKDPLENPEANILAPTTDLMLDDIRADLVRMCEERLAMYQSDEQRSLKNWQSQWDSYKARTQLFQLDVNAAEASLTFLTGKLERTKAQQTAGLIDLPEVEKATVELQLAEIQLRKALQLLKLYTTIESNNPELNPEYGDESSAAEETSTQ